MYKRQTLLCSLRFILFNSLWQNYLTLCKGLGLGLEVQSLGLGLDQKGLVLVLVSENFWSLGLGLETKVLVLVLKKKSYLHLCIPHTVQFRGACDFVHKFNCGLIKNTISFGCPLKDGAKLRCS